MAATSRPEGLVAAPVARSGRRAGGIARTDRSGVGSLTDFLLPATDAGVAAQAIGGLVLFLVALWFVRRNRDLVIFVVGLATMTAALMGLRMLH